MQKVLDDVAQDVCDKQVLEGFISRMIMLDRHYLSSDEKEMVIMMHDS